MRILSIIQPSDLGSDFFFDTNTNVWKVNFPAGQTGSPLSADANNALVLGTDQGMFLSSDLLKAYAMVQDNVGKKINLYSFPAGSVFDVGTATLVSSVNMLELNGVFDDVAIDGNVITFTDADSGLTLTLDVATLQKVSDITGSESINVMSVNGVTTLGVKISTTPENLIQVNADGLFVAAPAGGGTGGTVDVTQTLATVPTGVCHAVGNSHLVIPHVELTDLAGTPIGYVIDIIGLPVSSIKADETHCTGNDWDIKYTLKSTGEVVKLKTGPIVTRELIDPEVDFEDVESTSYLAWEEAVADRSELYIHRNVATVKEGAFANWSGLEKVHTDATELEENAFASDSSITEFVCLPNTRRILGTMVSGCQFTKLEFNEGLQTLHSLAFPGCNFPGGVLIIPDSVTKYINWAWNEDYTEKTEVIVSGMTAIYGIEKLIIGGGVAKIDTQQWSSMLDGVKHLEFRPGVTHITGFWNANNTCETLIFPQGLLSIGDDTRSSGFYGYKKLKELTIPGTVQYIGIYCFADLQELEKLTIERGVGVISEQAFHGYGDQWSNQPHPLKEFNFLGGTVIGEMAFQGWWLADKDFEIVIPDTVTEIKESAFQNHYLTKSLRFAEGCEAVVRRSAFLNWHKAEKLYISDSVKSVNESFGLWYRGRELYIGKGILELNEEFVNWGSDYTNPELSHLASKTIIIPDNVEVINDVFGGTSVIDTLIVSKGVKTLGSINSSYIKNLYLRSPETPTIIDWSSLLSGSPGQTVYVPSLVGYDSVVNSTFTTYTPPLNSSDPHVPTPIVVQEGDWDVQYTDLETGIVHTANGTVRGIIDDGFAKEIDSYLIDDVVIGTNVTHIGAQAFAGKNSIKRVQFQGNNLKSIGIDAFAGCFVYGGDVLTLPDSLERVGSGAFATLEQLNKLNYGQNLISVGGDAFELSGKFATPSKLLPPAPTFVSNTTTTITGTALAGDTIVGSIKRGEETIQFPPTIVGEDGSFTIDLSTLEEPATIQSGDRIELVVLDIVKNTSVPTQVVFM